MLSVKSSCYIRVSFGDSLNSKGPFGPVVVPSGRFLPLICGRNDHMLKTPSLAFAFLNDSICFSLPFSSLFGISPIELDFSVNAENRSLPVVAAEEVKEDNQHMLDKY